MVTPQWLSKSVFLWMALGAIVLAWPSSANGQARLSQSDWQGDLDFLQDQLPTQHINLFAKISKDQFSEAVQETRGQLGDDATANFVLLSKLIARVGDAHTTLVPPSENWHYCALQLNWFADGIYCVASSKKLDNVYGGRLVAINHTPIDQVVAQLQNCQAFDNDSHRKNLIPRMMTMAEWLVGVGLATSTTKPIQFEFEKGGQTIQLDVTPQTLNELKSAQWNSRTAEPALFERKSQLDCWNDWLPDSQTLFFKYNRCQNEAAFNKLVRGTEGFVAQNAVKKFVLDLRDNGGGNSAIFSPLHQYLSKHKDLNQKGKLFVIIGRKTFSSAILNALDMQSTQAILVGEPTSGKPNHFGELKSMVLPHSKLTVFYSTKYFRRDRNRDPESLMPDIVVEPTFADWDQGRDPVLEKILAHQE